MSERYQAHQKQTSLKLERYEVVATCFDGSKQRKMDTPVHGVAACKFQLLISEVLSGKYMKVQIINVPRHYVLAEFKHPLYAPKPEPTPCY